MDLLEYQGKQFFASFGIPVSPGRAVTTVDEAVAAADAVGYPVVVKAQVHVGGRGKAGGVKLANNTDEAREHAAQHPRARHQGPHRQDRLDRERLRHRRGVLRQLHARPCGQEAPRHAVGRGRRRDRDGGREEPRRHRQDLDRPGRRARPRRSPERGSRPPTSTRRPPRVRSTSSSSSTPPTSRATPTSCEINPLILTPDRRGPRPRRQGHPRRQRRVPPRAGATTTPPRCATSASRRPTTRACSTSASTAPSASSPTAPGWP